MKIKRSTKCSFKFVNKTKLEKLTPVFEEYGRVVNMFIDLFWEETPIKAQLLKPVIDSVLPTWLLYNIRLQAAREAIGMVISAKRLSEKTEEEAIKPTHRRKTMHLSSLSALLQSAKNAKEFDAWLHLRCIGNSIILDLPIKFHKHFHKLNEAGKRLNSYIITKDYVQFNFEIDTGPKQAKDRCVGIDTGINALATLSTGEQLGIDTKDNIERIKRRKHGSKGQKRASRALRQRMDEIARDVCAGASLVVVEDLKNITKNTKVKRRLTKNMRRSIGRWNVSYWLKRLKMTCEQTNVSWRTVNPYKTSQTCHRCGHTDRRNRSGEVFLCRKCGHTDNADVNAAKNILDRFLTGPYGAGCKSLAVHACG